MTSVLAEIWPVPRWWLRLPSPAASRLSGCTTAKTAKRSKVRHISPSRPGTARSQTVSYPEPACFQSTSRQPESNQAPIPVSCRRVAVDLPKMTALLALGIIGSGECKIGLCKGKRLSFRCRAATLLHPDSFISPATCRRILTLS